MTTLAESLGEIKKPWQWVAIAAVALLMWAAVALPSLHRSRAGVAPPASRVESYHGLASMKAEPLAATVADAAKLQRVSGAIAENALIGRKIVRTSSLSMIVQHPAEVATRIIELADNLGGYLESADGGGQDAHFGSLTIRIPANRFEQARDAIHKLGLHVESEKVDAQDVTQQYVDQEARIRNLRAEEAQYLMILKQATTVEDMLAVSEKLSEVRGQIEEQQAEFNSLSRQVETVAIAISLRTEPEPQVSGLNWHPGYQLKSALRDGLESVATYAATMTAILFYLPATLLWAGTIVLGGVAGWRIVQWGKNWIAAKPPSSTPA